MNAPSPPARRSMLVSCGVFGLVIAGLIALIVYAVHRAARRDEAPAPAPAATAPPTTAPARTPLGHWRRERFAADPAPFLNELPVRVLAAPDRFPPGFQPADDLCRSIDQPDCQALVFGFRTDSPADDITCARLAWIAVRQAVHAKRVDFVRVVFYTPDSPDPYYAFHWGRPDAPAAGASPPAYDTYELAFGRVKTSVRLTYRVTADADQVRVTHVDAQGRTQHLLTRPPWSVSFPARRAFAAYLAAEAVGSSAVVAVEILLDGRPWKAAVSTADRPVAVCAGPVEFP